MLRTGGDAFIIICLWQAGFAHTNPGRFSSHAGTPIFDPPDDTAQLLALLTNATFGAGVGAANQVRHIPAGLGPCTCHAIYIYLLSVTSIVQSM